MTHPLAKHALMLAAVVGGFSMGGAAFAGDLYMLSSSGLSLQSSGTESDIDLVRQARIGLHTLPSGNTEFKGKLGYQLTPNFAVEGGHVESSVNNNYARLNGGLGSNTKFSGMNVSALGIMPMGYQFSLFGKVGYTAGTLRGDNALGIAAGSTQDKNSLGMGLGGIYQLTPTIGVRAEWERPYTDVNLLTLGLRASF
jgi:OmpA-OmpF porin, OOP family